MPSLSSPTQSMDTVYPEPMSRLHRRVVPKKRRGGSSRYRTQPVTFSEIQEVDEDNIEDTVPESTSKSELNLLNKKFEEFKRSRDLMLSKSDTDNVDINKNSVPLSVSRSTGRLPSRPSF
ncbi:hypothetical protein MTP99_012742 [Tenebrio molitor]|uniref:uncharacterized protein isoform X1 n=2 Tax=Tenebrio molitor TaxID=7067 RepID=UPI00270BC3B0|nr:hypothetical protein MTP99_012742 [Tenebrio molitor]